MDKIIVEGGGRLSGRVRVNGAKNAALPIQCAALLGDTPTTLRHVPLLSDVHTMNSLLVGLGCAVSGERSLTIDPRKVGEGPLEASYELVKTMRASVTVMGPLLARYGRARISLPGGCAIGARPIDQHLRGLEALGAEIALSHGYVDVSAKRLRGATFVFDLVTVGGTQNVMMAAALARGGSRLENVASEPEVQELALVLNKMGARIHGAGTSVIEIEGVDTLSGIDHAILPDRIEAGTFMVAAAITGGDVLLEHAPVDHMHAVITKMEEAGVIFEVEPEGLRVRGPARLRPVDVTTKPHPGFPTDMQPQIAALLSIAQGTSILNESVWENRFRYVEELKRMGAQITVEGKSAIIEGVEYLKGAPVRATDLRAGAAMIIAGLAAHGVTKIEDIEHIQRGYEDIVEKFVGLGADMYLMLDPTNSDTAKIG